MTNYFPLFILVWMLIKYLAEESSKKNVAVSEIRKFIPPQPQKQIQYISNGRILNDTLFFYYYDMLKLTEAKKVNDDTIVSHAINRYALINKIDYDYQWPIATRDVNAAKAYVLERYYYMTNLN